MRRIARIAMVAAILTFIVNGALAMEPYYHKHKQRTSWVTTYDFVHWFGDYWKVCDIYLYTASGVWAGFNDNTHYTEYVHYYPTTSDEWANPPEDEDESLVIMAGWVHWGLEEDEYSGGHNFDEVDKAWRFQWDDPVEDILVYHWDCSE